MLRVYRRESKYLSEGTIAYAKDSDKIFDALSRALSKEVAGAICFTRIDNDIVNFYSYYDGSLKLSVIKEDSSKNRVIEGISKNAQDDFFYKLSLIKDYLLDEKNIDTILIPYRLGLIHLIDNANHIAIINNKMITLLPYIKKDEEKKVEEIIKEENPLKEEKIVVEKTVINNVYVEKKVVPLSKIFVILALLLFILGLLYLLFTLPIKKYIDDFFKADDIVYCRDLNDLNRASLIVSLDNSLSMHSFDIKNDKDKEIIESVQNRSQNTDIKKASDLVLNESKSDMLTRYEALDLTLIKHLDSLDKRAFYSLEINDKNILNRGNFASIKSSYNGHFDKKQSYGDVSYKYIQNTLERLLDSVNKDGTDAKNRKIDVLFISNMDSNLRDNEKNSIDKSCSLMQELKDKNKNISFSIISFGDVSNDYACIRQNTKNIYVVDSLKSLDSALENALVSYKSICIEGDR